MAGPDTTLIEEYQARIGKLRQELQRANDLIEYYRQFAPGTTGEPPPGYFTHQNQGQWMAGRLVDGHLEVIASGLTNEDEAVSITHQHHKELTQ